MKKISTCLALLAATFVFAPEASIAQRSCGEEYFFKKLSEQDPSKMLELRKQHDDMVAQALTMQSKGAQTAAQYTIPLAFHFVLTQAQYYTIGADSGIKRRVNSQIAALNRDYNGANPDKSKIPNGFKSLFATIGAQFGLANMTTANTITPGIEVKIVTNPPQYKVDNSCSAAKTSATGLDAWDNTKYLNIWVANIRGATINSVILGVTVPPSFVAQGFFPSSELGIVLNYATIGVREFPAQYFNVATIDKGRTLTHEMGHYFELWHTWGDDEGKCPGQNGGYDDGIADTPPQADATYCNSSGFCPQYPLFDSCSKTGNGIMFMNYMDYVDDSAMFMFTTQQATVARAQFIASNGPSYALTQNPNFTHVAVSNVNASTNEWSVSPNPATGAFHLNLDNATGFKGALVLNMMGQTIADITPQAGAKQYDIDLSSAPRGIYLVQYRYEGGTTTKKLVLE